MLGNGYIVYSLKMLGFDKELPCSHLDQSHPVVVTEC